jgi:3-oxoacyl-[acyl-carrier protein] reductase
MPLTSLSRSIKGEVAIVTGAASGMGRATAHLFGDEGARVALIDVNEEPLQAVVAEMTDAGYDARGWTLDLSGRDAIAPVVAEIAAHFGGIDILVNNAGISAGAPIDTDDYVAVWDRAIAVMVSAQMLMVRAALPSIRQSAHGRIVNIASTEGLGATPSISPYTTAKTAVIGFTRSLAVELGPEGITVNCVCPGPINTGMTAGIPDESKVIFAKRRAALRRYGEPEEVAHGTLSLVLPAAQYITGVTLPVDGGLTIRNA